MSSIMSKPVNPDRLVLVLFHNNTKDLNFNQNVSREWHATTSTDVSSLDELRENLNELIEKNHPDIKQSHTLAGADHSESGAEQKWNIQAISIIWSKPLKTHNPKDLELKDVRTPLDENNWEQVVEMMVSRDKKDVIRVQYEKEREIPTKTVDSEMIEEVEIFEGFGVGHRCG